MPYTLVHPAFVFPLKKWKDKWFSTEALIIGSFVPDFDIIFRFTENRYHLYTFTFINIITVILSIGILSYLFYFFLLKKQVDYILQIKNEELNSLRSLSHIIKVIISLFTAIYIHVYLDKITHPDAHDLYIYYQQFNYPVFIKDHLYSICLYGPLVVSSLIGMVLMIFYIFSIKSFSVGLLFQHDRIYFWLLLFVFSLFFFWLKVNITGLETGFKIDSFFLFSLSGLFYGFVVSCILFGFIRKIKL